MYKDVNPDILKIKGINPEVLKSDTAVDISQFWNSNLQHQTKDNILTEYYKNQDYHQMNKEINDKHLDSIKPISSSS